MVRCIAERLGQFGDAVGQHVVRDICARPDAVKKVISRYDLTVCPGETLEDAHGLWCDVDRLVRAIDTVSLWSDDPFTESKIPLHHVEPCLAYRDSKSLAL